LVLVSNDQAFGAEVYYLQRLGLPDELARYSNPSFEAVARGLGLEAMTIDTLDKIEHLRERTAHLEGPLLVDLKVATELREARPLP
jgi:thiamine pyrophosphate-dependent acetolactate synthase large subunit-like protein